MSDKANQYILSEAGNAYKQAAASKDSKVSGRIHTRVDGVNCSFDIQKLTQEQMAVLFKKKSHLIQRK